MMKFQPILTVLVTVTSLILGGCQADIGQRLAAVDRNAQSPLHIDPKPLNMSAEGKQAFELLKGRYTVVDSNNQSKAMTITDLVLLEKDGKPALYLYDSTRNSSVWFSASDCPNSGLDTNKGKNFETLNCHGSLRGRNSLMLVRMNEKSEMKKETTDPFIGLITVKSGILNTKDATHIALIQNYYDDPLKVLTLNKVTDSTALDLFKPIN